MWKSGRCHWAGTGQATLGVIGSKGSYALKWYKPNNDEDDGYIGAVHWVKKIWPQCWAMSQLPMPKVSWLCYVMKVRLSEWKNLVCDRCRCRQLSDSLYHVHHLTSHSRPWRLLSSVSTGCNIWRQWVRRRHSFAVHQSTHSNIVIIIIIYKYSLGFYLTSTFFWSWGQTRKVNFWELLFTVQMPFLLLNQQCQSTEGQITTTTTTTTTTTQINECLTHQFRAFTCIHRH